MSTRINIDNGPRPVLLALLVVLLAAAGIFSAGKWHHAQSELRQERTKVNQLSQSVSALRDTADAYQVELQDGRMVWADRVNELCFERDNVCRLLSDKEAQLRSLGIRLNDTHSLTDFSVATIDSVRVPVYVDTLQSMHAAYRDSFVTISAVVRRNLTSDIRYSIRDSFTLVNYTSYRRFLFFRWHRRNTYVLMAHNPRTHVLGLRVVNILR